MSGGHVVAITFFTDARASSKREEVLDLGDLAKRIEQATAAAKAELPWLKLGRFGERRSAKGSLRWDANLEAITGIEADYDGDGEELSFEDAVTILGAYGILCLVYTSPSHTPERPRWRVICPLAIESPPADRDRYLARLNGLFRGIFARESWTLSQSYYYGSVNGNPAHQVTTLDGMPIDLADELDEIAIGKPEKPKPAAANDSGGQHGPATPPGEITDARLNGKLQSLLANIRGAADGAKRHLLLANAKTIGGYLHLTTWTDDQAVEACLEALAACSSAVKDWHAARRDAAEFIAKGRLEPLELEDRPGFAGRKSSRRRPPPPPRPEGWGTIDYLRDVVTKVTDGETGGSQGTSPPPHGPGQGASQTAPPGGLGTLGSGNGNGGRVPPPGGPGEGAGDGAEPDGAEEQPDPAWDTELGPNGEGAEEIPPLREDPGEAANEAEAEAQIDAVPPNDVLNAIVELGPNITRKMLVALFNKRFAVAYEGSKTGVIWFTFDRLLHRDHIERAGFEDFKKMFSNRRLTVSIRGADGKPKKVTKSFGEWWLDDPGRQQYLGGVVFDPSTTEPIPHKFNLWRGWAVDPKPGDWSLMSDHIHTIICAGRTEVSSYVIRSLARMVQYPAEPGEVAIVVRGLKGVGKTMFGKWLLRLCGQHGLHVHNPIHLTGRFTGHLRDVILVIADEAFFAGDKEHERILKGIITDDQLLMEAKYRTATPAPNMLHLIMFSNEDWVIPATHDERRYVMLQAAADRIGDFAYFAALDAQMANGGLAAMLWDLQHMALGDFHPRRSAPDTPELAEQKRHSLDTVHRWWTAVLARGFVWKSRYGHVDFRKWDEFVTTELLARSYAQWCAENRVTYPAHRELLGKRLTAIYPRGRPRTEYPVYEIDSLDRDDKNPVVKLGNQMGYRVGSLEEARKLFAKATGRAAQTSEWDVDLPDC